MPLPPPLPPGPPPPPAFNAAAINAQPSKRSGGGDNHNQLLNDIRHGARLKKAVTNDRSGPIIDSKSSGTNKSSGHSVGSSSHGSQSNGAPPQLAGLFAGGMPKLKPTGFVKGPALVPSRTPSNQNDEPVTRSFHETNSNSYPSSPQPKSKSTIPAGFGTVRRGFLSEGMKNQAPPPPPMNRKPSLGVNGDASLTGHNRSKTGPPLPSKPPNVHSAKLTLSQSPKFPPTTKPPPPPKSPAVLNGPPALPSKPPNARRRPQSLSEYDYSQRRGSSNGRPAVVIKTNNIESSSSSSPVTTPVWESTSAVQQHSFRNASTINLAQLGGNVSRAPAPPLPNRDFSGTAAKPAPPPPMRTTPHVPRASSGRPAPPSVPFKIQTPSAAPPPPLSMSPAVPPPPPHRSVPPPPPSQFKVSAPSCAPPPPPVRNSSTRNSFTGSVSSNGSADEFDARFYHLFLSINVLPSPEPFTKCQKSYPSKNHAQRRDPPPLPLDSSRNIMQLQLGNKMWENQVSNC